MERIFINGIEIDREGEDISLIYQSPYFTDIDNIVSNRTTSVNIPRTPNNTKAVEFAGHIPAQSLYEYNAHSVIYYRDGVQLFVGTATLLGITPTAYKFSFVWGNVSTFKQMLDTNLRDLQTAAESDIVGYNDDAVASTPLYYPDGWNTKEAWGYGTIVGRSIQPIMPVQQIIDRIRERFGVSFSYPEGHSFEKYRMPITNHYGSAVTANANGARWEDVTIRYLPLAGDYNWDICIGGATTPTASLIEDGYRINTSNINTLRIFIPKGLRYGKYKQRQEYYIALSNIVIYGHTADNYLVQLNIGDITTDETTEVIGGITYVVRTLNRDYGTTLDVSNVDYVVISFGQNSGYIFPDLLGLFVNAGNMAEPIQAWSPDMPEATYGDGAMLTLYDNLPDMSVSDFLKNLMKIEGLFAYSVNSKVVQFTSIDELYNNRSRAYDWSDKIMGAPTEQGVNFNSLAQKNWLRYAEDERVEIDADAYIPVQSGLLEPESDLIEVGFAPSDDSIGVWDDEGDGVEWHEVEPRILQYNGERVTFDGLTFGALLNTNYRTYARTIERPRTVKANVYLTTFDLLKYDPRRPIYVKQWGHYYAIIKLTTKGSNTAEVELLQLGNN